MKNTAVVFLAVCLVAGCSSVPQRTGDSSDLIKGTWRIALLESDEYSEILWRFDGTSIHESWTRDKETDYARSGYVLDGIYLDTISEGARLRYRIEFTDRDTFILYYHPELIRIGGSRTADDKAESDTTDSIIDEMYRQLTSTPRISGVRVK